MCLPMCASVECVKKRDTCVIVRERKQTVRRNRGCNNMQAHSQEILNATGGTWIYPQAIHPAICAKESNKVIGSLGEFVTSGFAVYSLGISYIMWY